MTIIHFCAGLEPWNGMANTARQFVAEERAAGHDSELINDLSALRLRLSAPASRPVRLHIHGTWLPILWKAAKMAKAMGAEVIVRPAGNYDPIRRKQGVWKRFKKWLAGPWERAMLRRADMIQATCGAERAWIREYGAASSTTQNFDTKIQITDLKRFFKLDTPIVRPQADRSLESLHVLFLGRAEDSLKGVRYLKSAVRALNDAGAAIALRIVSHHTGEELARDWAWCDVLCLPTLSENFGRVIAEAIEHGRRVITTDGAPAWDPSEQAGAGDRKEEWRNGLIYLSGYREGTDARRVALLKDALKRCAG